MKVNNQADSDAFVTVARGGAPMNETNQAITRLEGLDRSRWVRDPWPAISPTLPITQTIAIK
jgi:hypothetical protein